MKKMKWVKPKKTKSESNKSTYQRKRCSQTVKTCEEIKIKNLSGNTNQEYVKPNWIRDFTGHHLMHCCIQCYAVVTWCYTDFF